MGGAGHAGVVGADQNLDFMGQFNFIDFTSEVSFRQYFDVVFDI